MRSLLKIDILHVDAQPADVRSYKRVKTWDRISEVRSILSIVNNFLCSF